MLCCIMKYIHTTTYSTEIEMNNPELHVSNWEKKKKSKLQEENTVGFHL